MSQEKVDKYKAEKANRKQNLKKEKCKSIAGRICAVVVLCAIVGWGGYSIYTRYEDTKPTNYIEVDTSAISNYQDSLTPETDTAQ